MSGLRYNLNLTEDYVKHWTVENALRELVANTIDEGGSITYEEGNIVFTTDKRLPLEALLMGYSVKDHDNPIGQYGEGLKLAMLVLVREREAYTVIAGDTMLQFYFEFPTSVSGEMLMGVRTLHVAVVPSFDRIIQGTEIIVYKRDLDDLYSIYTEAPTGLIPNSRGLYCQGLLVDKDFYVSNHSISYGVNLDKPVKLNRDRTSYEVIEDIVEVLELLDPGFFAGEFNSKHATSTIFSCFSPEYKQRVAKAWAHKNTGYPPASIDNKRVVFGSNGKSYSTTKEVLVITNYWYYGQSYLNSWDDNKLLSDLEINFSNNEMMEDRQVTRADEAKRRRLAMLLAEIPLTESLFDLLETLVKYIPLSKAQQARVHQVIKLHVNGGFEQAKPKPEGDE